MQRDKEIQAILEELCSAQSGDVFFVRKETFLLIQQLAAEFGYRIPQTVTHYSVYTDADLCPKCGAGIPHTYQNYCSNCGQKLKWISLNKMKPKDYPQ